MKEKKLLSIKTVNHLFITLITFLCVLMVWFSIFLVLQFKTYVSNSNTCYAVSKAALQLEESSDYLTNEVRFFILTYDTKHMDNYFLEKNFTKRRENAIETLMILHSHGKTLEFMANALDESRRLEEIEIYAMKLLIEGKHFEQNGLFIPEEISDIELTAEDKQLSDQYKISKAWLLLFSEDYMTRKDKISELNTRALNAIIDHTEEEQKESYDNLKDVFFRMILSICLIFILTFFFIMTIGLIVIKPIYRNINNISHGKKLNFAKTKEMNILSDTYNEMFDKNEAKEVLLRHKAEHDELTGVLNRTAFSQVQMAYKNTSERMSLILVDVDNFKQFNDRYGHSTGDKVLQKVASTIVETFRDSDYVARVGGDEFAIILTKCNPEINLTKQLIENKLSAIKETLEKCEDLPSITLSCGIDFSLEGYTDALYEHADTALYNVKEAGRNNYAFYKEGMVMQR